MDAKPNDMASPALRKLPTLGTPGITLLVPLVQSLDKRFPVLHAGSSERSSLVYEPRSTNLQIVDLQVLNLALYRLTFKMLTQRHIISCVQHQDSRQ